MSTKVIILGNTGFIGSNLMDGLKNQYQIEGYNSSTLDLLHPDSVDKLYDIVDEQTILIITARSGLRDRHLAFIDNITMCANIAKCLATTKLIKVIFFSSLYVYGDAETNMNITENTPINANTLYALSKYTGEEIIKLSSQNPLLILRPCMIYGPNDKSIAYGPTKFIHNLIAKDQIGIFGDGSELRDYILIDDLVNIVGKLIDSDAIGVYNIGTGQSHSFIDIINILKGCSGVKIKIDTIERDRPKTDQGIIIYKLLDAINGLQFTEIEDGLEKTFNYVKKHSHD